MNQRKIFEISDNSSYTTSSYAKFTVIFHQVYDEEDHQDTDKTDDDAVGAGIYCSNMVKRKMFAVKNSLKNGELL